MAQQVCVTTALSQNVDKVDEVARDLARLEQDANRLRDTLLALLVTTSTTTAPKDDRRLS